MVSILLPRAVEVYVSFHNDALETETIAAFSLAQKNAATELANSAWGCDASQFRELRFVKTGGRVFYDAALHDRSDNDATFALERRVGRAGHEDAVGATEDETDHIYQVAAPVWVLVGFAAEFEPGGDRASAEGGEVFEGVDAACLWMMLAENSNA